MKDSKRARYTSATDEEALQAFKLVTRFEKVRPSLEPAHAFAEAIKIAPRLSKDTIIAVDSCGDAKKDMKIIKERLGGSLWNFQIYLLRLKNVNKKIDQLS